MRLRQWMVMPPAPSTAKPRKSVARKPNRVVRLLPPPPAAAAAGRETSGQHDPLAPKANMRWAGKDTESQLVQTEHGFVPATAEPTKAARGGGADAASMTLRMSHLGAGNGLGLVPLIEDRAVAGKDHAVRRHFGAKDVGVLDTTLVSIEAPPPPTGKAARPPPTALRHLSLKVRHACQLSGIAASLGRSRHAGDLLTIYSS